MHVQGARRISLFQSSTEFNGINHSWDAEKHLKNLELQGVFALAKL